MTRIFCDGEEEEEDRGIGHSSKLIVTAIVIVIAMYGKECSVSNTNNLKERHCLLFVLF